jgi:hypothetical protein
MSLGYCWATAVNLRRWVVESVLRTGWEQSTAGIRHAVRALDRSYFKTIETTS